MWSLNGLSYCFGFQVGCSVYFCLIFPFPIMFQCQPCCTCIFHPVTFSTLFHFQPFPISLPVPFSTMFPSLPHSSVPPSRLQNHQISTFSKVFGYFTCFFSKLLTVFAAYILWKLLMEPLDSKLLYMTPSWAFKHEPSSRFYGKGRKQDTTDDKVRCL